MLGRLGLVALGLVAAFAVAEIAVRLLLHLGLVANEPDPVYPPVAHPVKFRPSWNQRLHWELDPHHSSTNSHGFRDRERSPEKPAGTVRIGVLGDSVTLGRGVPLEQSHPAVLEQLLSQELDVEVLNFGVGGYNTDQEVEIYARRGRRFDPDLLILAYVLNDALEAGAALEATRRPVPAAPPPQSRAPGWGPRASLANLLPLAPSELLELLRGRLPRLTSGPPRNRHPWLAGLYRKPESWQIVTGAMERLAAIAREDDDPVLVVIFPLLTDLDDYEFAWVHAQVRGEAERHGFDVLDLRDALREHDAADLRLEPRDTVHLGPDGLRLAALAIRDHLEASGELERLQRRADGYAPAS